MVSNAMIKTGQTKKFKSFYSGPQIKLDKINYLNFVIEYVKTKEHQKTTLVDSNILTIEKLTLL